MSKIPPSRMRLYLILLGLFPLFLVATLLHTQFGALKRVENELVDLGFKIAKKEARLEPNRKVRATHFGADHFWVDKVLETYTPLKPEVCALEKLARWGLPSREGQKRLALLQGRDNHLLFTESALYKGQGMEEVVESSAHPIQVDVDDLKALLDLLEGPCAIPRPHTLLTDFRLTRKKLGEKDEVFAVDFKFVKREFSL